MLVRDAHPHSCPNQSMSLPMSSVYDIAIACSARPQNMMASMLQIISAA